MYMGLFSVFLPSRKKPSHENDVILMCVSNKFSSCGKTELCWAFGRFVDSTISRYLKRPIKYCVTRFKHSFVHTHVSKKKSWNSIHRPSTV